MFKWLIWIRVSVEKTTSFIPMSIFVDILSNFLNVLKRRCPYHIDNLQQNICTMSVRCVLKCGRAMQTKGEQNNAVNLTEYKQNKDTNTHERKKTVY